MVEIVLLVVCCIEGKKWKNSSYLNFVLSINSRCVPLQITLRKAKSASSYYYCVFKAYVVNKRALPVGNNNNNMRRNVCVCKWLKFGKWEGNKIEKNCIASLIVVVTSFVRIASIMLSSIPNATVSNTRRSVPRLAVVLPLMCFPCCTCSCLHTHPREWMNAATQLGNDIFFHISTST